jgi:hypothetical protein
MNCARRRDPVTSDAQVVPRRSPAEAPEAGHPEPVWSPASADERALGCNSVGDWQVLPSAAWLIWPSAGWGHLGQDGRGST